LLDWAVAIGSRLDQLAVRAEGETSWAGVVLVGNHHWEITPLDLDLYNGLPGVVLFLAQLGNATGQGRWIELAQSAVATMQRYISEGFAAGIDELTTIGAFDGVGGLLYSLAHLQAHWQQPELLRAADLLVSLMENPGRRDMGPGLANGVAGGLVGLLALHQVNPTTKIERVTQQWGEYLLEVSQPGSNWLSNQSGSFGHTFDLFWHGAFGAAWALLAAADLMQQDRNYQAALTLIGEAFDSELDAPPAAVPGAALSCLRLLPYIEDATDRTRLKKYLKVALQMALAHQFSQNHSLGHGAFGCLDLLLQARAVLNDEPWVITSLEHKLAELAVTIRQDGWITGIPLGVESPGLMAGLAGIGYGLLRLANPQQTPSILAFNMPHL
jgi:lantibiotic modifying enzyme